MKSIRLNKESRKHILNSVMEKYKEVNGLPEPDDFEGQLSNLALKVYKRKYGKIVDYFKEIPTNMLNLRSYASLHLQNGSIIHPDFPNDLKFPTENMALSVTPTENNVVMTILENESKYKKQLGAYVYEQNKYKEQVETVINSCNTTGQLVELWPEVTEFIPETMRNPSKINLPSVCISNLNQALTK